MNEPQEIRMSKRVHAVLLDRHYKVEFPYSEAAVDRMRLCPHAMYDRYFGWSVKSHKHEQLEFALRDIENICLEQGIDTNADPVRLKRSIILHSADVEDPSFLDGEDGPEKVVSLSAPFRASRSQAKASGMKITGKMVRYAYHRLATELELQEARIDEVEYEESMCFSY